MTESPVGAISPELVLVCPELRSIALAMLPERDPDAFLPGLVPKGDAQVPDGTPPGAAAADTRDGPETDQHVLVAALRYVVGQSISVALYGVVVIAVVTTFLALAETIQR